MHINTLIFAKKTRNYGASLNLERLIYVLFLAVFTDVEAALRGALSKCLVGCYCKYTNAANVNQSQSVFFFYVFLTRSGVSVVTVMFALMVSVCFYLLQTRLGVLLCSHRVQKRPKRVFLNAR